MLRSFLAFSFLLIVPLAAQAGTPAAFGGKAAAAPVAASDMLQGKVLETMDVETYTYMRISTASGETWAAVPKTTVKVGSEVAIANAMRMDGFESKTLKRKFDKMVFGTLGDAAAAPAGGAMPANATSPMMGMGGMGGMGGAHGAKIAPVDLAKIKVEKAKGNDGRTVAEVYAQKAALKGKSIQVRAKVIKASYGILGKNWLHMSDGSGSEAQNNFDLIVTTKEKAKVGDVVLVKGTVNLDLDIGAGYKYPLLVEDAQVIR